tara:strand:+ start:353 stop:826 length:474 start_codon:yes stop_codon:yes gene_type:complete
MIKKNFSIIIVSLILISCGFTPTYKIADNALRGSSVIYDVNKDNSYQIRQVLSKNLINADKLSAKYIIDISVSETETAVNILSNGSVSKYRVESLINFKIYEIKTKDIIYKSKTRGFSSYDVSTSEYTNKLLKENALTTSLIEAIHLMDVIINSKIN